MKFGAGAVKDYGQTYNFYLYYDTIKYGNDVTFLGYFGTNAELLCIELCNFMQCHIFVNYSAC
jgi:hypothetical protein